MPSSFDYTQYFAQLHRYIEWQTKRIRELESRIEQVSKEVAGLRQNNISIDKIQYNFDQLKVERLDGTLNIGLSPKGLNENSIEEIAVNGQTVPAEPDAAQSESVKRNESLERVESLVSAYLQTDGPGELYNLAARYGGGFNEQWAQSIMDNIRSQTRPKVEYYFHSLFGDAKLPLTSSEEQQVAQRVIHDIRSGLELYMKNNATPR